MSAGERAQMFNNQRDIVTGYVQKLRLLSSSEKYIRLEAEECEDEDEDEAE